MNHMLREFRHISSILLIVVTCLLSFTSYAESPEAVSKLLVQELDEAFKNKQISSAAFVVVHENKIVHSQSYGFANYETKMPASVENTSFAIASITKAFTGLAIANLIEDGKIEDWSAPANNYLKRIQLSSWEGNEVTVGDLVTHTSGLDTFYHAVFESNGGTSHLDEKQLEYLVKPVISNPGAEINYSNDGLAVAGILIEDATGMTFPAYLQDQILTPLGMQDSKVQNLSTLLPNTALPYQMQQDGSAKLFEPIINSAYYNSVGSLQITLADGAKFLSTLLGHPTNELPISEESIAEYLGLQKFNTSPLEGYGYGIDYEKWNGNEYNHISGGLPGVNGAGIAYSAALGLYPTAKTGFFLVASGVPITGQPPFSPWSLHSRVAHILFGDYELNAETTNLSESRDWTGKYWTQRRQHTEPFGFPIIGGLKSVTQLQDGLYIDYKGPWQLIDKDTYAFRTSESLTPKLVRFALDSDNIPTLFESTTTYKSVNILSNPHLITRASAIGVLLIIFTSLVFIIKLFRSKTKPTKETKTLQTLATLTVFVSLMQILGPTSLLSVLSFLLLFFALSYFLLNLYCFKKIAAKHAVFAGYGVISAINWVSILIVLYAMAFTNYI